MMSQDQQIHVHKAIILELTMRTLERDKKHLDQLKTNFAFTAWIDEELKKLHRDLRDVNRTLGMQGFKVLEGTKKIDEYFIAYSIKTKGNDEERRYSVVALRNKVNEEVKKRLGLDYREI
ncbi:hypothetical protein JFL43_10845 [Viridibacillus sp. YIM B01967]|uniref:Uncharacterized protein n=1 Tax=Viridibacillus soli TaxID=2798301 RepID=A0ABS1H7D6_9BACL|nr:hypothetical protein [Viridibacillus soli]MBK3495337.1 hypothetical protein [Viridibacillus soli]